MPQSFCSHLTVIGTTKSLQSWILANGTKLSCQWCSASGNNQWLCLTPGCFTVGCGESVKDHSATHNEEKPDHCLQLNLSTNRVWCYACRSEVYVDSNLPSSPKELRELVLMKPIKPDEASSKEGTEESSDEYKCGEADPKGLVGLSNLGNTCYMNAALQALLNCPELTQYFVTCRSFVSLATDEYDRDKRTSLAKAYMALVNQIWMGENSNGFVAPSGVLHAVKLAHPMFRGFHQHDSQEFLRCFMDRMHEELKKPVREQGSESGTNSWEGESEQSEVEYETCDSGLSDVSANEDSELNSRRRTRKSREERERREHQFKRMRRERLNSGSDDGEFSDAISEVPSLEADKELRTLSSGSSPVMSRPPSPRESVIQLIGEMKTVQLPTNSESAQKPVRYRSIISDIFDGKVVSSVQCLTCSRVSSNLEAFQDLSLPIPTKEQLNVIQSSLPLAVRPYSGWVGWLWSLMFGWLWGPTVSLHDCLSAFFSSDELKGDNMYSCEKCKKLRNGVKMAALMELPEVLTIHLKRFRHELHFSTKISCKVKFPLTGLDIRPYVCKDCPSRVMTYDLIGVIVHHGTAGGGHYTAYALNSFDKKWYEYDDSSVTQVSEETVENCQAYVLFYRKSCDTTREELSSLTQVLSQSAMRKPAYSLVQFFISRQWLNKLKYFAEPGPIDNTDFLCKHGGVHPKIMPRVSELVSTMTEKTWKHLYSRFGGGPPCNALSECGLCRVEMEHLEIRRRRELEEYQKLSKTSTTANPSEAVMAMSMSWFRHWENFACARTDTIPGPIDNKPIANLRGNHYFLRPGSDHLQVSESVWKFFTEIYSGAPELRVRPATAAPKSFKPKKSDDWQSLGRSSFRNSESQE